MVVGILSIEISLGDIFSLKDKRQIVKSIIQKTKNRYNVSIAEVDRLDDKRRAVIGLACVSNSSNHVNQQLDHILNFFESDGRFAVENVSKEIL